MGFYFIVGIIIFQFYNQLLVSSLYFMTCKHIEIPKCPHKNLTIIIIIIIIIIITIIDNCIPLPLPTLDLFLTVRFNLG